MKHKVNCLIIGSFIVFCNLKIDINSLIKSFLPDNCPVAAVSPTYASDAQPFGRLISGSDTQSNHSPVPVGSNWIVKL